jgi:hypothetical protein
MSYWLFPHQFLELTQQVSAWILEVSHKWTRLASFVTHLPTKNAMICHTLSTHTTQPRRIVCLDQGPHSITTYCCVGLFAWDHWAQSLVMLGTIDIRLDYAWLSLKN